MIRCCCCRSSCYDDIFFASAHTPSGIFHKIYILFGVFCLAQENFLFSQISYLMLSSRCGFRCFVKFLYFFKHSLAMSSFQTFLASNRLVLMSELMNIPWKMFLCMCTCRLDFLKRRTKRFVCVCMRAFLRAISHWHGEHFLSHCSSVLF